MEYKVTGKYTFKDLLEFHLNGFRHKRLYCVLIIISILCLSYSDILMMIRYPSLVNALKMFSTGFIFLLLFYSFSYFAVKRQFKTDRSLILDFTLSITEEGILYSSERGSFNYKREDIRQVIFGKKTIAVYISNHKAIVIPRRFFTSKENEADIEQFIKDNYAEKQNDAM